jgi:hypothetical protein
VANDDEVARELYTGWFEAVENHDASWYDSNADSGFVYINTRGETLDRSELLRRDQLVTTAAYELGALTCARVSEALVVTGSYYGRSEYSDKAPLPSGFRAEYAAGLERVFSGVWRRTEGSWRCLLHHTTEAAKAKPAP